MNVDFFGKRVESKYKSLSQAQTVLSLNGGKTDKDINHFCCYFYLPKVSYVVVLTWVKTFISQTLAGREL